jgi:hypothetical protein
MPNKFTWGEDTFNTKTSVEQAIAKSIVDNLENTQSNIVSSQTRNYYIAVTVTLIPLVRIDFS